MSPDEELEQLLKVLIERFGSTRSLGEVYAATCAVHLSRAGGHIRTISEFAEQTGISKKNLSRWASEAVRNHRLEVGHYEDDLRKKRFTVANLDHAARHLPAVAEVLRVPMAPQRREN